MIKRPTISIVYDRRHVASNTKAASIEVRASYNGQSIYFNTGAAVRANEWRNGRVVRRDDMDALNKRIAAMYDNVSAKIDELLAANCYTNANLKAAILDGYKPKQEMWQWIEQRINERPLSAATKRQHLSCMSVIKEMGLLRQWSDLTLANIKRIDERLRASGLSQTTIYSYHKRLKPYLRDAVIFGMIAASPYDQFKTPHGASKRIKYLTAAECAKLEAASMPTATLQHAKDVWLYQRYTGLAYADLANLRSDNYIRDDGTGMASVIEKMDDLPIFGMLKSILADDDDNEVVKVMLFVMSDEEMEKSKKIIHNTVGLDEPNTGIMFAVPVTFVEGLGA